MLAESKIIEFKREYTDEIKKTVTAFANTDGGKIYVGIEDDGSVRGIADTADVLLRITNTIRDSIRPDVTLFTEVDIEQMDGLPVAVVTVQRGTARPYYLAGKGIRPEGVFVRQGASTVPTTEHDTGSFCEQSVFSETNIERYPTSPQGGAIWQ